jgi:hypothetical protein
MKSLKENNINSNDIENMAIFFDALTEENQSKFLNSIARTPKNLGVLSQISREYING